MLAFQGPHTEINAGGRLRYRLKQASQFTDFVKGAAISFGGHYRFGDAAVVSTLIEFGKFALGVSYDINVSGLQQATNGQGGIEISLRFINPDPFTSPDESSAPRL
jgi:hypothetical protein